MERFAEVQSNFLAGEIPQQIEKRLALGANPGVALVRQPLDGSDVPLERFDASKHRPPQLDHLTSVWTQIRRSLAGLF